MNYLYHLVPENMKGDTLMPLNELKKSHPKIYAEQIKKYEGREVILEQVIPSLHCLWNDVLHITAVDLSEIKSYLEKLRNKPYPKKWRVYKIDPKLLDPKKTTVYLYPNLPPKERTRPEYFVPFSPLDLEEHSRIPPETLAYFRDQASLKKRPLLFHLVPHILYKGTLHVNELEVIEI